VHLGSLPATLSTAPLAAAKVAGPAGRGEE
jgi:hypothetical protein